jgi:hypothetical protein
MGTLLSFLPPLVKAIGKNETPALFQQPLESRFFDERFSAGIYHLVTDGRIFRPRGNQSPPKQLEGSLAVRLDDHGRFLTRSDVVSGL